jgi:hypothetical protein
MEPLVIRRSAWRMWLVALLGVPMIVVALDLLTQKRLTNELRDLLFLPDATQLPEPREYVWAVALLIAGSVACLWGLKELLTPTKVVQADSSGLRLKIAGPFKPPLALEWTEIADVGSGTVDDDGDELPVVWIRTVDAALVPTDGWGARPIDAHTFALLAADWELEHVAAAKAISSYALEVREAGLLATEEADPVDAGHTDRADAVFDPGPIES